MNDRYRSNPPPAAHRPRPNRPRTPNREAFDDEHNGELDSLVIEAIENIVNTSRRLRNVQQRRHRNEGDQRQETARERQLERAERQGKLAHLRPKGSSNAELEQEFSDPQDPYYHDLDEDTCALPGLTSRQRQRAQHFAEWLMQQDNYPIILQHVEELLLPLAEDEWPDDTYGEDYGIADSADTMTDEDYDPAEEPPTPPSATPIRPLRSAPNNPAINSAALHRHGATPPEVPDPLPYSQASATKPSIQTGDTNDSPDQALGDSTRQDE